MNTNGGMVKKTKDKYQDDQIKRRRSSDLNQLQPRIKNKKKRSFFKALICACFTAKNDDKKFTSLSHHQPENVSNASSKVLPKRPAFNSINSRASHNDFKTSVKGGLKTPILEAMPAISAVNPEKSIVTKNSPEYNMDVSPTPSTIYKHKRYSKNVDSFMKRKFSGVDDMTDDNYIDNSENTYNMYTNSRRNSVADQISKLEVFNHLKDDSQMKTFDLPPIQEPAYECYSLSKGGKKELPHKDTLNQNDQSDNLDDSFISPQMIDNSAILFTNNKKKKQSIRQNVINHLQSDADQHQHLVDDKSMVQLGENQDLTQEDLDEGEDSGEGESGSSSCSCSSCLRERNADNAVSLKLSQYSYLPTKEPVKHISENNSHHFESDEVREDDLACDVTPRTRTKLEFPDNLNNG
jgi:hypothetical protein